MKTFFVFLFFSFFVFPPPSISPTEVTLNLKKILPSEQYAHKIIRSTENDLKSYAADKYLGPYIQAINWDDIILQMSELWAYPYDSVFIVGQIHMVPANILNTIEMSEVASSQLYVESALSIAGKKIIPVFVEGFAPGQISRDHIVEAERDSFSIASNMQSIVRIVCAKNIGEKRFEKEKPYNAVYRLINAPYHTYLGSENMSLNNLFLIMNLMVNCFSTKNSQAQAYYSSINNRFEEKLRIIRSLIILSETLEYMHAHGEHSAMIIVGYNHIQDYEELERNMIISHLVFQKINTKEILTASQ